MDKSAQTKLKQFKGRELRNRIIVIVVCIFMILTMVLPYLAVFFS